jgi:hypothetical protein
MSAGVAAGADLSGLFSWWIQELRDTRALVAERYGAARSARFQLQLFADHAELSRIGDSTGERRPFKIDGVDLPALDEIWPADKPRNARLDIVLADADVLVFQLLLPPLSDNELGNAVELQLERKLPLPRELLYIAWEVTQKLPDRSRIVSVAAARRSKVNEWRERVRAWGWRVTRVCCKDAGELCSRQARGIACLQRCVPRGWLRPGDRGAMDLRTDSVESSDSGSSGADGQGRGVASRLEA